MKKKGHGTVRGFAWRIDGRLTNWSAVLASSSVERLPEMAHDLEAQAKIVAVRVITEGEFQRLVKRALVNDTYDLFQRRRKP